MYLLSFPVAGFVKIFWRCRNKSAIVLQLREPPNSVRYVTGWMLRVLLKTKYWFEKKKDLLEIIEKKL